MITFEDAEKYGLTVGQVMGTQPLTSHLPIRYQYLSRTDNTWKDADSLSDMKKYQKYDYETRIV